MARDKHADRVRNARRRHKQYGSSSRGRKKNGCYVATAVYGSYDCPQVWVLRRYRDERLSKSKLGRLFIKGYYLISPTLVSLFGKTDFFQRIFRIILDKKVMRLKEEGLSDAHYSDND